MKARARFLVLILGLSPGACDLGPEGPGELSGMVASSEGVGAVLLEIAGGGIDGFEGQGDTQAIGAPVSPDGSRHRVVLVSPAGGPLRFRIRVRDLSANKPVAEVLSAASPDDVPMPTDGVKVRIAR